MSKYRRRAATCAAIAAAAMAAEEAWSRVGEIAPADHGQPCGGARREAYRDALVNAILTEERTVAVVLASLARLARTDDDYDAAEAP